MSDLEPTLASAPTDLAPAIVHQRPPRPRPLPRTWAVGDELPHDDYPDRPNGNRDARTPLEGMGVTMGCGSDSYPGTVVWVSPNGRTIHVAQDHHCYVGPPKPYGDPGKDEDWVYTRTCHLGVCYTLRKDGKYHREGRPLKHRDYVALGRRHYHYDPHV